MKRTILVCDCCKEPKDPAVASLSINDGRGTAGEVYDICGKHLKTVRTLLTVVKESRQWKEEKRTVRVARMKEAIISFATGGKSRNEIAKQFKLNTSLAAYHIYALVKGGKLKSVGKGSNTKYFPVK